MLFQKEKKKLRAILGAKSPAPQKKKFLITFIKDLNKFQNFGSHGGKYKLQIYKINAEHKHITRK